MSSAISLSAVLATNSSSSEGEYGGGLHYAPTRGVTYVFIVLFSISTLAHLIQAIYYRKIFMIPTAVFGGVLEVVEWAGRLWQSLSPYEDGPFQMNVTATVLGPTPLVAANFVILGRIIEILGPQYSRIKPKLYAIIFCVSDVISLLVQGTGGGVAGGAGDDLDQALLGSNIALGGTSFQLGVILLYVLFKIEFFARYAKDSPIREAVFPRRPMDKRMKVLVYALSVNTVCLVIRAVYRIAEFAGGWDGHIINTEVYFNVLDGMMVILAIYILNFVHPGFMLPSKKQAALNTATDVEMRGMQSSDTMIGPQTGKKERRHH